MYQDSKLTNDDIDSPLTASELVFTQQINEETGEHVFVGGGYKVNSFFLQKGISPMTTYNINHGDNSENNDDNDGVSQKGGTNSFENLAVPAGLFYINQKYSNNNLNNGFDNYKQHEMLPDDIFDKLFTLIEYDKKQKRKSKKNLRKIKNKKTRRQ
jgi:hypothetical protein